MAGARLCNKGPLQSAISLTGELVPLGGKNLAQIEDAIQVVANDFLKGCDNEYKHALCATCFNCPSREVEAKGHRDMMKMSVEVIAKTWCGKIGLRGRDVHPDPYCPDKFDTVSKVWADPQTITTPFAKWEVSPIGAGVTAGFGLVTNREPFNPKFQNNDTVAGLEQARRKELMEAMEKASNIGSFPSHEQMQAAIDDKDRYEREEFFNKPMPTIAAPRETFTDTRIPSMDEVLVEMKARDLPQAADAGSW